ncbi:MAG: FMN-binding protein, partial [Actinomycetota bacterium]|nr:FMN-binding protein [Actinomycetota bacterium]
INGTFLGLANDANPYGTMQVQIVVTNSVITAVTTPVYPNTGDSKDINAKALPKLQQEAIVAQSSKIASVSGATYSSKAFKQSLQSAIVLAGLPG